MADAKNEHSFWETINPLDPDAGLNIRDVPLVGNLFKEDGIFSKATTTFEDGVAKSGKQTKEAVETDYGKDAGNHVISQAGTAVAGAALFGVISNKLSGGNKLWTAIGGLAGAVIMHKIGPELITDVQRGWQYVDQQKALGKSDGKFADRFDAIFGNIKTSGQAYAPTTVADADPDPDPM